MARTENRIPTPIDSVCLRTFMAGFTGLNSTSCSTFRRCARVSIACTVSKGQGIPPVPTNSPACRHFHVPRATGSCPSVHGSRYAAIGPLGLMMTRALLRINLQTIRRAVVTVPDCQFEGPLEAEPTAIVPFIGPCVHGILSSLDKAGGSRLVVRGRVFSVDLVACPRGRGVNVS